MQRKATPMTTTDVCGLPTCTKDHHPYYPETTPEADAVAPFDTAVPIDWMMDLLDKVPTKGLGLLGCIVWSYKGATICGQPAGLCDRGKTILARYEEAKAS